MMSDNQPSTVERHDAILRNLIDAAWRFLDHTKEQRELQGMEEYRNLGRATNEAMRAHAK
jgi:hypothetical protein